MTNERLRLLAALTDSSVWMAQNQKHIERRGENRFVISRDLSERFFILNVPRPGEARLLMRDCLEGPVSSWFYLLPWSRLLRSEGSDKISLKLDSPVQPDNALFIDIKGDPQALLLLDRCPTIKLGTFGQRANNEMVVMGLTDDLPVSFLPLSKLSSTSP